MVSKLFYISDDTIFLYKNIVLSEVRILGFITRVYLEYYLL